LKHPSVQHTYDKNSTGNKHFNQNRSDFKTKVVQDNCYSSVVGSVPSDILSVSSGKNLHQKEFFVDDYHRVSTLFHRITNQSGLEPGQTRVTKTPDNRQQKADHMAELQLKEMKYSERLKAILADVITVHVQLKSLVPDLQGHRFEWGSEVDEANRKFLSLFESMIAEILLMHRKKFKVKKRVVYIMLIIVILFTKTYFLKISRKPKNWRMKKLLKIVFKTYMTSS
jgi:hypothetical protein